MPEEMKDPLTPDGRLKVYDVYTRLLIGEADRVWSRFTAYLTVNTAIGGIGTWIVKQGLTENGPQSVPLGMLGIFVAGFGAYLSFCWYQTVRRGQGWQSFYIEALRKLENRMEDVDLWTTKYACPPGGILEISKSVIRGFFAAWACLIVFSIGLVVLNT